MRTVDFSPLFSSTVGFDRVFDLLEEAANLSTSANWPPYDIVKLDDDHYRIVMAVAGFSPEELDITAQPEMLIVRGQRQAQAQENGSQVLHRGLAEGFFERRFELADYVNASSAKLDNGLLTIELVRELPEAKKPRRIEIQAASPRKLDSPTKQVEHGSQRAAA